PADSICIIMKPGNTSAIPASASVPSRDTNHVSIRPVEACTSITTTFGQARRNRVGVMRPSSRSLVRGLSAPVVLEWLVPLDAVDAGANAAVEATLLLEGAFIRVLSIWIDRAPPHARPDARRQDPRDSLQACA